VNAVGRGLGDVEKEPLGGAEGAGQISCDSVVLVRGYRDVRDPLDWHVNSLLVGLFLTGFLDGCAVRIRTSVQLDASNVAQVKGGTHSVRRSRSCPLFAGTSQRQPGQAVDIIAPIER
jgi:hypothetical protein